MKRALWLIIFALLFTPPLSAAQRVTLEGGNGVEKGTSSNPLVVVGTGSTATFSNLNVTGNVGIGISAPLAKMNILAAGSNVGHTLNIQNQFGTSQFNLIDNGNIGIGVTTPAAKMIILNATSAPANSLYLKSGTTGGSRLVISQPDGGCSACGVDAAGTTWSCVDVTCP